MQVDAGKRSWCEHRDRRQDGRVGHPRRPLVRHEHGPVSWRLTSTARHPAGSWCNPRRGRCCYVVVRLSNWVSRAGGPDIRLCIAWLHRWHHSFLDTLWKSPEELGFRFNTRSLYTNCWISIIMDCQVSGGRLRGLVYRISCSRSYRQN